MGKTDYTKVEGALEEGLRKMEVNRLLKAADEKSGKGKNLEKIAPEKRQLLVALVHDLKYLKKVGADPFVKLSIDRKFLRKALNKPESVTEAEWKTIQEMKEKVAQFKVQLAKETKEPADEQAVDVARKKQKTKRFNIKDDWIPLR